MTNRNHRLATLDRVREPRGRLDPAVFAVRRASAPGGSAAEALMLCPAQARSRAEQKPSAAEHRDIAAGGPPDAAARPVRLRARLRTGFRTIVIEAPSCGWAGSVSTRRPHAGVATRGEE